QYFIGCLHLLNPKCHSITRDSIAACDCRISFLRAFLSTASLSLFRWVMVRTPDSFTSPARPCRGDIFIWHEGESRGAERATLRVQQVHLRRLTSPVGVSESVLSSLCC